MNRASAMRRRARMARGEVARRQLAPALARGDLGLAVGQAENVGRAARSARRRGTRGWSSRPAPRCRRRGGRRNGSAAPPPAPSRSGRRCSAAPPRRAGAGRGCRRPGNGRGRRTARRRRAGVSGTTATICGITSPARCSTTVSPMRTSLRAISSSLCSVALLHQHAADVHRRPAAPPASARRCGRPGCRSPPARSSPARPGISTRSPSAARGRRSRAGAAAPGRRSCRRRRRCRRAGRRGRSADVGLERGGLGLARRAAATAG